MRVRAIFVYPVKGARGSLVNEAWLGARGLTGDRRFMVVDADGRFRSQREQPELARLRVEVTDDALVLDADGLAPLRVPAAIDGPRRDVTVHKDTTSGVSVGPEARAWLSAFLGAPSELVYMPDDAVR